ncbi:MAG TPA: lysylphosphatidylglycerol synthase transmembrane domain-containing protein [Phycisphaerae bacterium]|nr:lysylphosphatidylglycerol synthase transmembrane domain-containing protein [Phycisphaerae bacterium]
MRRKVRKWLVLSLKLAIAAVLLGWVLGQVHWRDYVQGKSDGRTYPVLAVVRQAGQPAKVRIARGPLGSGGVKLLPMTDFEPLPSSREVLRPGFARSLREIHVPLALLGAAGFGAALVLIAVRWRMLLKIQDIRISLWETIRLTFLGQFFNAIVPGTVGGDLVKVYYVCRHTPKKAAVLVSVFVDRLLGLVELALMAAGMLLVVVVGGLVKDLEDLRLPAVCVAVVLVAVGGMLPFLLSGRFRRALRLERLYQRLPVAHHIAAAGDAAVLYRKRLGSLVYAVLISFAAHLAFVGFIYLTGKSLAVQTPWYNYFLYVPLIYIIGSIPLTPGGVGWVENWYVKFFESPQCGASTILVLALLARLIPVLWGLPGAVVAVTGAKLPKAGSIEAELGVGAETAE